MNRKVSTEKWALACARPFKPEPRHPDAAPLLHRARKKLKRGGRREFPLIPLATAMRDLGLAAHEIRALIDLGYLVAFNIAASDHRPELRILADSVRHFKTSGGRGTYAPAWPALVRELLPPPAPTITGIEIQRALNCDRSLVQNLVDTGHLVQIRPAFPGPGGSRVIGRPSLETFLQSRQL
jgi:hypothetical protein